MTFIANLISETAVLASCRKPRSRNDRWGSVASSREGSSPSLLPAKRPPLFINASTAGERCRRAEGRFSGPHFAPGLKKKCAVDRYNCSSPSPINSAVAASRNEPVRRSRADRARALLLGGPRVVTTERSLRVNDDNPIKSQQFRRKGNDALRCIIKRGAVPRSPPWVGGSCTPSL